MAVPIILAITAAGWKIVPMIINGVMIFKNLKFSAI